MEVAVRADRGDIVMEVSDHGKGFDVNKVLASELDVGVTGGHFGLRGMRDRVEIMNGQLSIVSGPGGTRVTIRLPAA